MTRLAAVLAALAVLGCGSESDTTQPTGSSKHPSGYVLHGCSYVCGSTAGHYSDSACASGQAHYTSCGGATKQQCTSPSDCMTCYSVRWVCE